MGISIPEVPFSGSMGECRLLKGLKIVCGKRTTFLRIKNIPTGRSCRPSWGISLVSLGIVTYLSYSQGGVMHGGYGVTGVLATIYSLIGLILGILTLREKDIYRIFPVLGTILNVVALGGVSFLLYLGSRL